jgi:DNA-binding PucR family transcriptional regulator
MQVRDLVDMPDLHLVPLTEERGFDRAIRWVYTTDLLDPGRYLSGGELVLTGMMWRRAPEDSATFVATAAASRIACLAAGDAAYGTVPDDLLAACREHGVPLLEVPVDVSFATITERVIQQLTVERQGDLAAQLGRRRRLLAAVAEGAGLTALLELWAAEAELPCWLLTSTGRAPAETTAGIDDARAARLAAEFLRAKNFPQVVRIGRGSAAATYSLFSVGTRTEARIAGWFLACEGDHPEWPRGLHESVTELVSLVALERERLEETRRGDRVAVEQLVRLVLSGRANPAEVSARFAATGLAGGPYAAVTAALTPAPDGQLASRVLDELLATATSGGSARVAAVDDEAVGLVPLGAASFSDPLRAQAGLLDRGLAEQRLLLGVSLRAEGPAGLSAALNEARQARRLAELRPGRVAMLATDEIDSHALLLATVPDDVRQTFRSRVLGTVLEYDAQHNSELVPTLEAFLEASCSWTHCAERLHVHVNTLRYRIQRIEDLTGRSVANLEDRVDFFLALRSR